MERLLEAIQESGGAMHACLEFAPPLPKSALEEKYSLPEIYLIVGDECFETDAPRRRPFESDEERIERVRWLDAFYERPVCRRCLYSSARRTDKQITLKYAPVRYDGAFGSIGRDGGQNHQIVSEEFLALLSPREKRRLEFRPTIRAGRRKFYELVGPEGPRPVAVVGVKHRGWRCSECDHRTWDCRIDGMAIAKIQARDNGAPARSSQDYFAGGAPR
jgi:hypothetical protein